MPGRFDTSSIHYSPCGETNPRTLIRSKRGVFDTREAEIGNLRLSRVIPSISRNKTHRSTRQKHRDGTSSRTRRGYVAALKDDHDSSSTIKHGVHVHAREFASTNTTDSDRPIPRSSPPISRLGVSACMHAYTYTIVLYRPTNPSPLPAAVTVPVARPLTLHRPDIIHRHTRTKHITSVTYLRLIQNAETNFKRMAWPRKVKSTGGGGGG